MNCDEAVADKPRDKLAPQSEASACHDAAAFCIGSLALTRSDSQELQF